MWRLEAPFLLEHGLGLGLELELGLEEIISTWKFRSMQHSDVYRKNLLVGQAP
jgi:hypothetical protein